MANLERVDLDGVTVLSLRGSLSEQELLDVEQSFHEATHQQSAAVILNLADVDFLTTPAISMFLEAARSLRGTGGRIVVSGPQPRVGDVLRRLRLERLLPVCETVDDALKQLKG